MKMKIQYAIAALALALTCGGLSAQNLNPTVSVSREYEGKLMEVSKPSVNMPLNISVSSLGENTDRISLLSIAP